MRWNSHIVTYFFINNFINLLNGAVEDNLSGRHERHLPALFQFFRGLHSGENDHHIQPYYFLPSLLVFPSINQQHNTIVQESSGQENYQEINKSLHMKKYEKLVSSTNTVDINETVDFNKTVYIKNSNVDNMTNQDSELTQFDNVTEQATTQFSTIMGVNKNTETSTEVIGIYPPAKNNSEFINSLSITTDINEVLSNHTSANPNEEESKTKNSLFDSKNTQKLENNLLLPLEKLLNTFKPNASENYNLPLHNNRWHLWTQKKDTPGFKPLAGLYYDGFLHKPLTKKNGFVPV